MKVSISSIQRSMLGLVFLGGSFFTSSVLAEGCTPIDAVPAVITTPGTYCLTGDLEFSGFGDAIHIQSENVSLDFQGYELKGSASKRMTGVRVSGSWPGIGNVVVRNGKITNALEGVILSGSDLIVENMVITNIGGYGVQAQGFDLLVRNNVISNIVPEYERTVAAVWVGNCTQGTSGVRVLGNEISGFARFSGSTRTASGIESGACGAFIEGNRISSGNNSNYGIFVNGSNSTANIVLGNRFIGSMSKNIYCNRSIARYKDNIASRTWGFAGTYDCPASGDVGGNF